MSYTYPEKVLNKSTSLLYKNSSRNSQIQFKMKHWMESRWCGII